MSQRGKTIIMYSWSTVWSMKNHSGAPSFYKTIDLYIKKGCEVHLILTDDSKGATEMAKNCHLHTLGKWKTDTLISEKNSSKVFLLLKMWRYYCFAKRVTKSIMKNAGDDVIFYAYEIHGVSSAKWASKRYQKPLVTRYQGTVATYFKDNLATKIKQYFHLKALKEKADLVIMTDDGTKGLETLKKLGNPSKNIKFWKNGLDLLGMDYRFSELERKELRATLGIAEDEFMLLTVSRLQNWKRIDRAIRALAELCKKSPKFKLVVAGDGPERDNLQKMAEQLGVENNVIFLGAVAHNQVYDYMSSADVFLSLYDMSNVGNPLLEALTLGRCVVTLDVGDTGTVVKNGYNGVLLQMNELERLPEVIFGLYKDTSQKQKLESNAKEYAKNNFYSWDKRMEMEYDEILKLK